MSIAVNLPNGYCVHKDLIDKDLLNRIEELYEPYSKTNIDAAFDRSKEVAHGFLYDQKLSSLLITIIESPPFKGLILQHFKRPVIDHIKVLLKSAGGGMTQWHQDSSYWKKFDANKSAITFWIPINNITKENGCLRVINCFSDAKKDFEHIKTPSGHLELPIETVENLGGTYGFTDIEVNKGDLVLFHSLVPHMAYANNSPDKRLAIKIVIQEKSLRTTKVKNPAYLSLSGATGWIDKNLLKHFPFLLRLKNKVPFL